MNRHLATWILFLILLLFVLVSAYRVVQPFLAGFTWAAVLVATFRPFHERLTRAFGGRHRAATAVVTLLVAMFVAVPLLAAAVAAVQGGIVAIQWIVANYQSGGMDLELHDRWPRIDDAVQKAMAFVGLANIDLKATAMSGLESLGSLIAATGPQLVGGAVGVLFSFVVMLATMPVLFSSGEEVAQAVAQALPVPEADGRRIIDDLTAMTRSVFMSVGLTALAQAALGGVALLVLGVPHVAWLTAGMFFCALFPGGTAIVRVPAAIWLAAIGLPWKATILAAWGAGVVSTIDNVLRPLFAGKGVNLPSGLLFLGMFGGVVAFGLVGVFVGPIVLYLARELLAILRRDTSGAPAIGGHGV